MMPSRIGFLGFGEVASIFCAPMRERGAAVAAYDVLLDRPGGKEILERRVKAPGITFGTLAQVVAGADYVLSTVTTQVARDVARECLPHLRKGQIYLDLNSTAPSVKREMAGIVAASHADFVEGAILGAIGATGAATEILIGGPRGQEATDALRELGLRATYYSSEFGKASTFKMLRSIVSKGMEALLLELMLAARRAGMEDDLWRDLSRLFSERSFERVADNWIRTHPAACERRFHEMVQVVETVRELGVDPLMSTATTAFFQRSRDANLTRAFSEKPDSVDAVVKALMDRLGSD